MSIHSGRELTDAIVTALRDAGLIVGKGDKNKGAEAGGWQGAEGASTFISYVVVFPTPGGFMDGTLGCPFTVANADYTITGYGISTDQAEDASDDVRAVLQDASAIVVAGRSVQLGSEDVLPGAIPDYDRTPTIFFSPARWRVMTTAAA